MKITVLSGSPKGSLSVTLQYVNFIAKKFPDHTFQVHHVGERIQRIARDPAAFQKIMDDVRASDAVIWAFPVYAFVVPSQFKRFIELIFENRTQRYFRNRYAVTLSTSLRFFDHTAHNYLSAVCDDLGMKYWASFSADTQDLLDEVQRDKLIVFAQDFFKAVEKRMPAARTCAPLVQSRFKYQPGPVTQTVDSLGKKIVILTDSENDRTNLGKMVRRFKDAFSEGAEVVNINDIDITGGCLGCAQCAFDNKCVYQGKDGFIDFNESLFRNADAVAFAPVMKDRYFSWKWKQFIDRGFYRGHTPGLKGKQVVYILSGPLQQIPNLRQIIAASSEMGKTNLVDIVTDESEDSAAIDARLQNTAARMMAFDQQHYVRPPSFLYVGGHKLFRDMVWSMRAIFQADYRYYRKNKMLDFPQNDKKAAAFNKMMMSLTKDPGAKEEIRKMMKKQMVKPHMEVVATK